MNFKITEKIEEKDRSEIFQGLLEYNLDRIEDRNPKELGIYLEDEQGRKQAGLIGETHGNWLMVKFLWVDESLRGRHIGSRILEEAEIEARKRGCKYAFLDTFSFQAPDFYKKHGYREVFALEEYPLTGKRYYLTKTL
ncbi:GNAT family N-acetyltransferase [Hungatella sp. L12]|uniref:GNAT family N-acetyltransferase n=1 Tax=Hungatella hominis TaxID=2763050 RepID=A0ABR7H3B1_9FIRM|nr:GNAT family N-acetyltransferase [Hungatella hominis]MBC5707635.1 GNAT family N-acetyltransferase [Hungatella hominis]